MVLQTIAVVVGLARSPSARLGHHRFGRGPWVQWWRAARGARARSWGHRCTNGGGASICVAATADARHWRRRPSRAAARCWRGSANGCRRGRRNWSSNSRGFCWRRRGRTRGGGRNGLGSRLRRRGAAARTAGVASSPVRTVPSVCGAAAAGTSARRSGPLAGPCSRTGATSAAATSCNAGTPTNTAAGAAMPRCGGHRAGRRSV
mmetsp:Transcript_87299/g.245041  ORF Transcript_87299/g.245041 Transcript_87299/m.245041 type:complete len:205 (+) Transcript_87299:314-928(+)